MTPITLPAGYPRCPDAGQGDCHQAGTCARALVAHDIGRPVRDFSTESGWKAKACIFFLAASSFRPAAPVRQPTVHEAPRGLA